MQGGNTSWLEIRAGGSTAAPEALLGEARLLRLTSEEALVRDANRMAILRHLSVHPGETRRTLARVLALPQTTVASLVRDLLLAGWLQEVEGARVSARGRAPAAYRVRTERLLVLNAQADAGSVRVLVTTMAGELLARDEAALPPPADAAAALDLLTRLLLRTHARLYSPQRRVMGIDFSVAHRDERCPAGLDAEALLQALRGTPLGRVPLLPPRGSARKAGGVSAPAPAAAQAAYAHGSEVPQPSGLAWPIDFSSAQRPSP